MINNPNDEPARHFRFDEDGITVERTLILEVSGGAKRHHSPGPVGEKADTTRHLWVPAVDRHGRWGRWAYIDVVDPERALAEIDAACADLRRIGELVS